jgi:hypothetical protein
VALDIDFITVALATYQRPKGLQGALAALALQRFDRLRVLVSDDAPSDESRRNVENVEGLHVVYLPRKTRQGVLRNHLSMIPEVTSDLFMFHGDDDEVLADALCQLSEPLKASQVYDAVFSNYRVGLAAKASHSVLITRLPFARYWSHRNRYVRMLAYYLCPAFLGKQNIFYGLFRTNAVYKIDIDKVIPPRQHRFNMDEMFAFQAVCNGPVLVIDSECFFFAQGNLKHYVNASKIRQGTLWGLIEFIHYEWVTLFDYLRNAPDWRSKIALVSLFPIKFTMALVWRYVR